MECNSLLCHEHISRDVKLALIWLGVLSLFILGTLTTTLLVLIDAFMDVCLLVTHHHSLLAILWAWARLYMTINIPIVK